MDNLLHDTASPDFQGAVAMEIDPSSDSQPRWRRWLTHWQATSVLLLMGLMGWMVVSLLLPRPHAEIALAPLTVDQLRVVVSSTAGDVADTALLASEEEEEPSTARTVPQTAKKPRTHTAKKKPAKPPVLNLNTASLSQLELLPGIGPKMAERVVEYRKAHGAFSSPEQVMDVKGIGPKKFEKLKAYLKV